jgi:hypothetical protein
MAPGLALRTLSTAVAGSTPSSTKRRAAIVPARPRPPRQCTRTSNPLRRSERNLSPAEAQVSSKRLSGVVPSAMGRWNHCIPRRNTSSPRFWTSSRSSSSGSNSVTTATAPQMRIASRSSSRSRSHSPVAACLSFFPGHKVIPARPNSGAAVTNAICRGSV